MLGDEIGDESEGGSSMMKPLRLNRAGLKLTISAQWKPIKLHQDLRFESA